jgi:hypothetical protein
MLRRGIRPLHLLRLPGGSNRRAPGAHLAAVGLGTMEELPTTPPGFVLR